jgi:hypothetical protein
MKAMLCCAVIATMMVAPVLAQDKAKVHRKRAAKPVAETTEPMNSNQASWELVKGASWLVLPSWAVPIYMTVKKNQDEKDATAPKAGKRSKQAAQ